MARKGATTRDPKPVAKPAPKPGSTPASGASKWTRTGVGTYKDQYGNVLKGQKTAPKRDMSQRNPATPAAPTPQPTEAPAQTPESVTQEGFMGAGEAYGNVLERFKNFDPYKAQQQYEPVYSQEMERARQNIMDQFQRRNQRQFEQQRTSLQQQIAERGLDPASPAAQELMRQQNERETLAQQEAMSAAEQAADARQQQLFGQAGQTAMMPYDIFGSTFNPAYMAGIGAEYAQQQQQQQQDWQARQAELDRRNQRWMLRNQPRAGGGGGGGQQGPTLYERMQAEQLSSGYNQPPQQNPWAGAASGFAAGVGQGVGQWIAK